MHIYVYWYTRCGVGRAGVGDGLQPRPHVRAVVVHVLGREEHQAGEGAAVPAERARGRGAARGEPRVGGGHKLDGQLAQLKWRGEGGGNNGDMRGGA